MDAKALLLEYARFYGISHDHTKVNPLELFPPPNDLLLKPDEEPEWLTLDPGITTPPSERLVAVKAASVLLAALNPKQYESNTESFGPIPAHRIQNLKLEPPLLRSDHDMDMLSFVRRIDPNLAQEFIPPEVVDDELDEGLGWPSSCLGLPDTYFQKAQDEKLQASKHVFAYIRDALDNRVEGKAPGFEYEWPKPRKRQLGEPVTPPLFPRSPSPHPYEPSSQTGRLELLSDHSSPTSQEIERIEKLLVETDAFSPIKQKVGAGDTHQPNVGDVESIGDLYSPLKGIKDALLPPTRKRRRLEDLKVEGPLTPPPTDRLPPWENKKGSISDLLHGELQTLGLPFPEAEQTTAEDIDTLFAEEIAPLAVRAERAVEQEQLQEADTTSRVSVPIMDFTRPTPPWKLFLNGPVDEREKMFLCDMKEKYLHHPPWRVDVQAERALSWSPFPSALGRFELKETIENDGSLAGFLEPPERPDLFTLVWERPGLKVLDHLDESEEDELECGCFPEAKDVGSLIKQRNFELQDDLDDETVDATRCKERFPGQKALSVNKSSHRTPDQSDLPNEAQANSDFSFSAAGALGVFLGLRKGELQTEHHSVKDHNTREEGADNAVGDETRARKVTEPKKKEQASFTVPTPYYQIPDNQRFFVASTTFLSNRKLARHVQDLYPTANIIERDFALYNPQITTTHLPPRTTSAPSEEADLILSPSTGLILTNLPKIKQQALPGQAARSPIRERIQQTASRYERLVVMVSRSGSQINSEACTVSDLDESDCEAYASFTAFMNSIPSLTESEVLLIDGDVSTLATWVVSLMIKYSADSSINLLQDETQWEVFLRQAGMNAFAAQAVLAEMKVVRERGDDGRPWGLREFVLMTPLERRQRFKRVLGGEGMLERVGKALDVQW